MERTRPRVLSAGGEALLFETRNRVIESAGFEVVSCRRGLGVRERFVSERFDAVVLGSFEDSEIRQSLIADFKRINPRVPILVLYKFEDPAESFEGADQVMEAFSGPENLVSQLRKMVRQRPSGDSQSDTTAANAGD